MYRGNHFVFSVLDKNGNIFAPEEIYACIKHILGSNVSRPVHALGALTGENRDVWAGVRERLEALGNKEALNAIDTALYAIALDDNVETGNVDQDDVNFLTGDPGNR
jgi:hypothetical protein